MPEITCSEHTMQDSVSSCPGKAGASTEQFQQHMEAWWLTWHQPSPHGKVQQIMAGKAAGLEPFSVFSSQLGVVLCGLCQKKNRNQTSPAKPTLHRAMENLGRELLEMLMEKQNSSIPLVPHTLQVLGYRVLGIKYPFLGCRAGDCGIHYHNKSL